MVRKTRSIVMFKCWVSRQDGLNDDVINFLFQLFYIVGAILKPLVDCSELSETMQFIYLFLLIMQS